MKALRIFCLTASVALPHCFSSCVATHVKTQSWEVSRVSVLSGHEVPGLTMTKDGDASLTGYTGKPDVESIKAITEGVTRALAKP